MNTMNRTQPDATVEAFKAIAGDGDMDERCRRILGSRREAWWGVPYENEVDE
jgi:hypothetical protein